MKKPAKSKTSAPVGHIEPAPAPEPEIIEAAAETAVPVEETPSVEEMPIFHLSLDEWLDAHDIVCSCRGTAQHRYHEPTCARIMAAAEWRVQCHARHERIRHAFPLLKDFKDGWARESEQTMKDRLRMQMERAS